MRPLAEPMAGPSPESLRAWERHLGREVDPVALRAELADGTLTDTSYWEMTAGAANAADLNFASSLAEQYAKDGIRVNTVNPGPVNTTRWDGLEKAFARDLGVDQQVAHELAESSIPFGRICEPEDVPRLVPYLASPHASFINGAHIPIDGGQRKAIMDAGAQAIQA
jgi:NAD(P)-dependent dehydrogenase (short-subunit alcohol dehydrogenase family)